MAKKTRALAIPQITTLEQADAHQRKHGFPPLAWVCARCGQKNAGWATECGRCQLQRGKTVLDEAKPKGKLRGAVKPNATERDFGNLLEAQRVHGDIVRYVFHGITLRWGTLSYTPDYFVVVRHCRSMPECHQFRFVECKGDRTPPTFLQHAVARYKGARDAWHEFDFQFWQRQKNVWTRLN